MITAKLHNLRMSPRKVRLVADLVRGANVVNAEKQLRFCVKKAAAPILKLLNSAIANAEHNFHLNKEGLKIAAITVDAGPTLKRWRPRAMGRTTTILKRTSHITLILEPKKGGIVKPASVKKPEKIEMRNQQVLKKETMVENIPESKENKVLKQKEKMAPVKPYHTTSQAKKKFFSRQTFGNVKKIFRRKSS